MSDPIELFYNQEIQFIDEQIMRAVVRADVKVNREELIRLLKRDRPMQYEESTIRFNFKMKRVTKCPACHKIIMCDKKELPHFCIHCGQKIVHR